MQPQEGFTVTLCNLDFHHWMGGTRWTEGEEGQLRVESKDREAVLVLVSPTGKVSKQSAYLLHFIMQRRHHPLSTELHFSEAEKVRAPRKKRKEEKPTAHICVFCTTPVSVPTVMWVLLLESTDHVFLPHVFL